MDVSPSLIDRTFENQYIPAISLPKPVPKIEWVGQTAVKKQYAEEAFEQRKEEPVAITQYEASVTGQ